MYTQEYVNNRFYELAEVIRQARIAVKVENEYETTFLHRMKTKDYHEGSTSSLARQLKIAKRLARFYIQHAIAFCPAMQAKKERFQVEYLENCRKERERNPDAFFFSFETEYASKLSVNFNAYKHLFKLTPKRA